MSIQDWQRNKEHFARMKMVESEYKDSDGYWINLKRGWCQRGEQTHGIVEDTKAKAYRTLRTQVVPCDCAECKA